MGFLLPDPNAPVRKGRTIKWIVLLVLLLLLGLGAQSAYHKFQKLRTQRLRAQAEALLQQKNYDGALAKARECLAIDPHDQAILRTVAMALTAQDKEEALVIWKKLLSQPGSGEADRRAMIALALRLQRPDLAELEMEALLQSSGTNASVETERLAASYYSLKGDMSRSLIHARKVLAQTPDDEKTRFITGKVLIHSLSPQEALEGKRMLWEYAKQTNSLAWEAIQLLSDSGSLTGPEAIECIRLLDAHPVPYLGKIFLKGDLQIVITPYKKNQIVQEVAEQVKAQEKPELLPLGRWLNRYEAYSLTIQSVDLNAALKNRDLLLIYLDAVAAQNDWARVESILAKPELPLEPVMIKIFQARTATELRQERVPDIFWEQAQSAAGRDSESLLFLARYAEKVNELDHAARAYRAYLALGKNLRPAFESLIRVLEAQGATRPLRDLLADMARKYPEDPLPRNDLAYLNLLLNE
ncbi:MAG: tetratricopeptide repeat protein, partial [Verrucomicrobiales bacterium]